MFQDQEGIPSQFVSESAIDRDFIAAYKRAEKESRESAFIAWAEYTGRCDYDEFDDAYRGEAESEEDYAQEMVNDNGLLNEVPEPLRSYFDFEAYVRDLFSSGYVSMTVISSVTDFPRQAVQPPVSPCTKPWQALPAGEVRRACGSAYLRQCLMSRWCQSIRIDVL